MTDILNLLRLGQEMNMLSTRWGMFLPIKYSNVNSPEHWILPIPFAFETVSYLPKLCLSNMVTMLSNRKPKREKEKVQWCRATNSDKIQSNSFWNICKKFKLNLRDHSPTTKNYGQFFFGNFFQQLLFSIFNIFISNDSFSGSTEYGFIK